VDVIIRLPDKSVSSLPVWQTPVLLTLALWGSE